tara:strand:+ start:1286 stop:1576 length:291 start_codon:yes stop_codon:yes gene_type:complete
MINKTSINPISLAYIVNDIYDIDIIGKSRDRHISDIRKMYCVYVYRNSRITLQTIGNILGRSIGNVSYYLSMHDRQMGESEAYADNYANFQDRINK